MGGGGGRKGIALPGSVTGCRAYLNRRLAKIGVSVVLDCSVSGSVAGVREITEMARAGARLVGELLKIDMTPIFSERELIGRSFELYKFRAIFGSAELGELRLVARGDRPLSVSGVLYTGALGVLPPEVNEELSSGRSLSIGVNVGYKEAKKDCPVNNDVPPGQVTIPKFVVYVAEGEIPNLQPQSWRLTVEIGGRETTLTYDEVVAASRDQGTMDFHCVTGWTVRGKRYGGVLLGDLLRRIGNVPDSGWIYAESVTGYSSVMPLSEAESTMLVVEMDGKPLQPENGGPVRLFNPNLYGWKGAKWVSRISLVEDYVDGFWEALAYHERGLVARNERFKIRNQDVSDLC